MSKLLSIGELSEKLSVHPDTIRKWELLGHISSIKTMGGHRRYVEAEVDHLLHRMKFQGSFDDILDPVNGWYRKDKFIFWKKFVQFHDINPEVKKIESEVFQQQGAKWVVEILDKLSDDDWNDVNKIDEILEPIYVWYRESKIIFWKPLLGTNPPVFSLTNELKILSYKIDGVFQVLWSPGYGIAFGGEESVMKGNGSFPNEKQQMEKDIANGWDGKGSFAKQRQKLMYEAYIERYSKDNDVS